MGSTWSGLSLGEKPQQRSRDGELRGGEWGGGSSWVWALEVEKQTAGTKEELTRVRALVLVSRGGKRARWVMRLGSSGWWQRVRGADGTSRRVGCLVGVFLQKINRKLPSTVLTPPGRAASQNLLVSWCLCSHQIAVKLIGIKCFTPSCVSTVAIFCY